MSAYRLVLSSANEYEPCSPRYELYVTSAPSRREHACDCEPDGGIGQLAAGTEPDVQGWLRRLVRGNMARIPSSEAKYDLAGVGPLERLNVHVRVPLGEELVRVSVDVGVSCDVPINSE